MIAAHRIDGDGERTVVLSGSLGTTLEMWDDQVSALSDHFKFLRYDHPGHGRSPLPEERSISAFAGDVLQLLDELNLGRVSFCGVSLGGGVGMQLALDAPDRLDKLVLACTSARFATAEFWDERAATVRAHGVEAVADAVVERWFTPEFGDMRRYRRMLVSTPAEGYASCCDALRDWDVRGALDEIRAPTLVIAGADDPATPLDELQAVAEEVPDAKLLVLDRARHLANVERATEFNGALFTHLGR